MESIVIEGNRINNVVLGKYSELICKDQFLNKFERNFGETCYLEDSPFDLTPCSIGMLNVELRFKYE